MSVLSGGSDVLFQCWAILKQYELEVKMGFFLSCFLSLPLLQALAHKTLVLLLGVDPSRQLDHPLPTVHPQVTYAYMKHMWKSARKVQESTGRACFHCSGFVPCHTC